MEASVADVEFKDGNFRVAGTDKTVPFGTVALTAYVPHNYPITELEPGLDETAFYDPLNFTYPGRLPYLRGGDRSGDRRHQVVNFTAVDDVGRVINPMIVEGQVHGGVAQGIGQALLESCVYDTKSGQLLTGSLMDYTMPRADDLPNFKVATHATMCTHNPLGSKGVGEVGAIGSPPAVINAVLDALKDVGVQDITMPATPPQVWQAIQNAQQESRGVREDIMYNFTYHRPSSVADAVKAISAASDGKILAGGQTLLPTLKQRLAEPIGPGRHLGHRRAQGHQDGRQQPRHRRGDPPCRGRQVVGRERRHPALAALAEGIGDPPVRNRGTIGGSVANNDPAADYPAGLLGLGATIHTNKREIAADDFFKGMFETALEAGEIVTAISFPKPEKAGYAKFPNPASRYAMVGVFVAKTGSGVRVAVTGAGPCVFRSKEMEQALVRQLVGRCGRRRQGRAKGLNNDIHGSADYRAHLVTVMAKRAVAAAG